ncbi:UvrD-like helicase C-terminal domain-containing protein [Streptomyces sp. DvalAA-14]|nr:ATP-binding domain-containing protein [Streptomyces sp. SID4948]SCE49852.1 UvrD-like helicase C-terminal domain-containing protein [Streptomyces sp. DvalAA-14]
MSLHPFGWVLCRTNAGAMTEVLHLLEAGYCTALVGGGGPLRALALAANDLKEGRRTDHPELVLFPSWGAVQDYAAHDPAGGDLQPLVDLVARHGTEAILTAVSQLHDEQGAQVTVSTAHKAKGREWTRVRIADDFPQPKDTDQRDANGNPVPTAIDDADARLAYVAITRARHNFDRGGLAWIDHHPDGARSRRSQ